MGSVSRLTLVELIEEQKARLSSEALELWGDVDAFLYLSPEEETRLKPHERAPFERIGRLPEAEQRAINVLTELRAGLYQSDLLDDRGKPSQGERDRCVIRASIFKDRDERGPGMPLSLEERLGRTVDQAIARLKEGG
jgi:hypothetical protein